MKFLLFIITLSLAGCGAVPQSHLDRIERLRLARPYASVLSGHSMGDAANETRQIVAVEYDRLTGGAYVVYWPYGRARPIAHLLGHRIGTDSWQAYGTRNAEPDPWLVTRENFIGLIR